MSSRDDLQTWQSFFQAQSHILATQPQLLFQQAANSPDDTLPALRAHERIAGGSESRPWLRLVNKAQSRSACLLTLTGHNNRVNSCTFSPQGTRVLSGEWLIKLWDAFTGEELSSINVGEELTACSFSPDSRRIAFGTIRGWGYVTIQLWDVNESRRIATLYEAEDYWKTHECAFSPNGELIACAGGSYGKGGIRVFAATSGVEVVHLEIAETEAYFCAFSQDGKLLAGASKNSLKVWETSSWAEQFDLKEFPKIFTDFQGASDDIASPIGLTFSTGTNDLVAAFNQTAGWQSVIEHAELTVKAWDISNWREVESIAVRKKVASLAFSSDGSQIAYMIGNDLCLWCPKEPDKEIVLAPNCGCHSLQFSRDGNRLVAISDQTVQIWDTRATASSDQKPEGHARDVRSCTFSPDGDIFVTASDDHSLKIWDGHTGQLHKTLEVHMAAPKGQLLSPDGETMLSWDDSRLLALLLNYRTGEEIAWLGPHSYHVLAAAFSPDGSTVATGTGVGGIGELYLWDTKNGNRLLDFTGHTSWIKECDFSADGKRLVSSGDDQTLRLWDAGTGKQIALLAGEDEWMAAWSIAPDASRIVGGTFKGAVIVWDCEAGRVLTKLKPYDEQVTACACSPDSKFFATAATDGKVKLWEFAKATELATLHHNRPYAIRGSRRAPVEAVFFSPDAKRLASFCREFAVTISNAPMLTDVVMAAQNTKVVQSMGFTPDGCFIWSRDNAGWVSLWDAATGETVNQFRTDGFPIAFASGTDGSRVCLGDTLGLVYLLQVENRSFLPPVVTARRSQAHELATRCPFCRRWIQLAESELGGLLDCSHCGKTLRLNPFKVTMD